MSTLAIPMAVCIQSANSFARATKVFRFLSRCEWPSSNRQIARPAVRWFEKADPIYSKTL
jgi:hypothetical protein